MQGAVTLVDAGTLLATRTDSEAAYGQHLGNAAWHRTAGEIDRFTRKFERT